MKNLKSIQLAPTAELFKVYFQGDHYIVSYYIILYYTILYYIFGHTIFFSEIILYYTILYYIFDPHTIFSFWEINAKRHYTILSLNESKTMQKK